MFAKSIAISVTERPCSDNGQPDRPAWKDARNGTREEKKEDGPTPGLLATLTYSGERRSDAGLADHPGEDGYRIHLKSRSLPGG